MRGIQGAGVLDFVAAWYVKASPYIRGTNVRCAFVSTNSITQGEQVGVLWAWMFGQGVKIHFAHRTFRWSNEGRGVAAVHCVIIGFGACEPARKTLFLYDDIKGEPHSVTATNINAYLVDAADVLLDKRRQSICAGAPAMAFGSMPNDGGNLILDAVGRVDLLRTEPDAAKWIRRLTGSDEFLNGIERWCLWLGAIGPKELRSMPQIRSRVESVRETRLASNRATTRSLASTPTLFGEIRQPKAAYVAVPEVS